MMIDQRLRWLAGSLQLASDHTNCDNNRRDVWLFKNYHNRFTKSVKVQIGGNISYQYCN